MSTRRPPEVGDTLYRAESSVAWYSTGGGYDMHGEWHSSGSEPKASVFFREFVVVVTTKHCMWIQPAPPTAELVRTFQEQELYALDSKGRPGPRRYRAAGVMWAWPTKEEALYSLQRRTSHRIGHARRALKAAECVMAKVKELRTLPEEGERSDP